MNTIYQNFDIKHIPDNEAHYFGLLESVISNVDNYCYFTITKTPHSYNFRISTSQSIVNPLVKQINMLNTASGIAADWAKSMKSGNIFWKIEI